MEQELQVLAQVEKRIHELFCKEMEQWQNVDTKNQRTDEGYVENRKNAALDIIRIVLKTL